MKKNFVAAGIFVAVCLEGGFCMLAGGVDWGTAACGMAWFMTFVAATAATIGFVSVDEDD